MRLGGTAHWAKVKRLMTVARRGGRNSRRPDERFPPDAGPLRTLRGESSAA
jgi:hypothetical protein